MALLPRPPLNQACAQAESEGLYKYLMQFHTALGFVMTKYAPDLQATVDLRLPRPAPFLCRPWYPLPSRTHVVETWLAKQLWLTSRIRCVCYSFAHVELNATRVRLLGEDIDVRFVLEVRLSFSIFVHKRSPSDMPPPCVLSPPLQVPWLSHLLPRVNLSQAGIACQSTCPYFISMFDSYWSALLFFLFFSIAG